jgi:uncharacterized membrane protein
MTVRVRRVWTLALLLAGSLVGELTLAPTASAFAGGSLVPVGLFGLPSLHSIIQAIASGFFGALAGALVPGWLKHGTVATIQHLVALPDPATWSHVSQLQGETTYLAAMLLPVTLAVGAVRYWLIGLTGTAHPASALARCTSVTGVLVVYRWIVEQSVAATNTLTHGILGLPAVGDGLQRIIGVLFGGALLSGAGGVFGAFLVIIGVVFAAGLFAAQVLLTVVLAVLIVAGPPLIALSAIPELSHLSRSWAHALLAVALVPLGWTVLFATAGALCLDATSFTGASGGLPGHVAAAFAGLITFVIAARLPLMAMGEVRHLFSSQRITGPGASQSPSRIPGSERVRAAHARLRAVGLEGVPSLGRSVGRAAGALGAPQGGPAGAARRGLAAAARRTGIFPSPGAAAGGLTAAAAARRGTATGGRRGVRERLAHARSILANAPAEAMTAVSASSRRATRGQARPTTARAARAASTAAGAPSVTGNATTGGTSGRPAGRTGATGKTSAATARGGPIRAAGAPLPPVSRATSDPGAFPVSRAAPPVKRPPHASRAAGGESGRAKETPPPPRPPEMHPAGKLVGSSRRDAAAPPRPPAGTPRGAGGRQARAEPQPSKPPRSAPPAPGVNRQGRRPAAKGKPRPRSRP